MVLSVLARRAQSRLANATKSGYPPRDIARLRTAFAVERALDAVHSVPGALSIEERGRLATAVAHLPVECEGGESP